VATRTYRTARWATLLVFLWCSCVGAPNVHRATRKATQREAGSVHLAVVAVAPWSHYADALQPSFHLTAEEALELVIQDSRSAAMSESMVMGLAANIVERPETHGVPADNPLQSTRSSTFFDGTPLSGMDASLRFQTANALFQEIQLLNRVIRDAAIPAGYRPYLVRLQITLLPRSRHEPYDAYVTLSFFGPDGADEEPGAGDGRLAQAFPGAETADPNQPPTYPLRSLDFSAAGSQARGPSVLPLLVSDNLEATVKSNSASSASSLALSILAFPGTFASQLNADLFSQGFAAQLQARDLNSLLTVGRLSENTLRVRLGAMQEATADYAMVPRNHNVTLLVMVPEEAPGTLDLVGRVRFVDAETGEELPATAEEILDGLLAEAAAQNGLPGLSREDLRQLVQLVQANDQVGFFGAFSGAEGASAADGALHALWVDLVDLMAGSQYFSSSFDLPGHTERHELTPTFFGQTALALDDGVDCTSIELQGALFEDDVQLGALLTIFVDGQEVLLPARSVSLDSGRRSIQLEFPSLEPLGLASAGREGMSLMLDWVSDSQTFEVLYASKRGE